jgi:hypothetical protein
MFTTSVFTPFADTEKQKETHCYRKHEMPSGKEDRRPKGSVSSSNKGPRKKGIFYSLESGQRPWIKKKMNTCSIEKFLV